MAASVTYVRQLVNGNEKVRRWLLSNFNWLGHWIFKPQDSVCLRACATGCVAFRRGLALCPGLCSVVPWAPWHCARGRCNEGLSGCVDEAPSADPPGSPRLVPRRRVTHTEPQRGRLWTWTAKTVKRPRQQPAHPQYANYWAPLTRKRRTMPHSAQPQHTNHWAPRTRKRHQQEHRPQRPTESSDPTQHAKGRTGDCPGPRKGATTRRNVTQGGPGAAMLLPHRGCQEAGTNVGDLCDSCSSSTTAAPKTAVTFIWNCCMLRDVLERLTTVGGLPPPPQDQSDHLGTKRNLPLGISCEAIFGSHIFGSQTPPPPFSFIRVPHSQNRCGIWRCTWQWI